MRLNNRHRALSYLQELQDPRASVHECQILHTQTRPSLYKAALPIASSLGLSHSHSPRPLVSKCTSHAARASGSSSLVARARPQLSHRSSVFFNTSNVVQDTATDGACTSKRGYTPRKKPGSPSCALICTSASKRPRYCTRIFGSPPILGCTTHRQASVQQLRDSRQTVSNGAYRRSAGRCLLDRARRWDCERDAATRELRTSRTRRTLDEQRAIPTDRQTAMAKSNERPAVQRQQQQQTQTTTMLE